MSSKPLGSPFRSLPGQWSFPSELDGPGLPRLGDTAKSRVMFEEKLAGVKGLGFEVRTVGRYEPPVTDLAGQQFNDAK